MKSQFLFPNNEDKELSENMRSAIIIKYKTLEMVQMLTKTLVSLFKMVCILISLLSMQQSRTFLDMASKAGAAYKTSKELKADLNQSGVMVLLCTISGTLNQRLYNQ